MTAILAAWLAGHGSVAFAQTPLPPRADRAIHDTAGVLDPASEARLEAQSRELYDKAGVAIVVVTVPRLVDETIAELAVRVGQSWGVGQRGTDRGLVVALARDDRKIFVATGYGTEGYLPDGKVGRILDQTAIPHLRANRFSEGIVALTAALAAESAAEYGVELTGAPPPRPPPKEPAGAPPLVVLALIALGILVLGYLAWRHPALLLFFLFANRGRGRGGRGSGDGGGFGGFGGGGFGGGGAGRSF